jgi:hypothetical protein
MTFSVFIALQKFPWCSYVVIVFQIRCKSREIWQSELAEEQAHACAWPSRGPRE